MVGAHTPAPNYTHANRRLEEKDGAPFLRSTELGGVSEPGGTQS